MDNYHDIEEPKKGFTVGKLLKWIFALLSAAVFGILFVRCMLSRDVPLVSKIIADDEVKTALADAGGTLDTELYGMKSAWVAVEEGRLVEFNKLDYLPAVRQLQCSVKFREDIVSVYGEDGLPFAFTLTDEDGNIFDDYYFETADKNSYSFIRLSFRGIDLLTGETDGETGLPKRHTYTLHLSKYGENGETSEYTNYRLYDGSPISKTMPYKG